MAEKPSEESKASSKAALDLNSLSGLDFGPNWADSSKKPSRSKSSGSRSDSQRRGARPRGAPRDRRSAGARSASGGEGRRREERGGGARRAPVREVFQPTVNVNLYPQDEAFEALVKRLRATARTYQLFEIAHLLLEKPERYVVVVSNKSKPSRDEPAAPLFFSVPGHLPFETEEAAVNHVLANHLDQFFDVEAIEVESPKGNFQMVNRCTITGELLGPPNYHRYQEFVQRHYHARINGMSFDRFQSRIETVKEQEQIDAWLESMKKGARYTVKAPQEGEPEVLESLEAVRHFLLKYRKDQVVGSGESVRFAGRDIEKLPKGDIRRSVEAYVEQQLHFPLDTANNIRGRLRRQKFTVYKKGSKGVSYVCAVKRKFRDHQTVFTASIRDLIEFIEKHPNTPASQLPRLYIGIDTEKQKPEALKVTEAEVAAAAEAKAAKAKAEAEATDSESTESTEATEAAPQPVAPDAAASTDATPKAELSEDEQKQLNQLMLDLRWLITEGYVTEYGDGRLFAAPPMPEPKKKESKPSEPKPEAADKAEAADKTAAADKTEAKAGESEAVEPAEGSTSAEEASSAPAPEPEPAPEIEPEVETSDPASSEKKKEEESKG